MILRRESQEVKIGSYFTTSLKPIHSTTNLVKAQWSLMQRVATTLFHDTKNSTLDPLANWNSIQVSFIVSILELEVGPRSKQFVLRKMMHASSRLSLDQLYDGEYYHFMKGGEGPARLGRITT
jgi:hypothetical protein